MRSSRVYRLQRQGDARLPHRARRSARRRRRTLRAARLAARAARSSRLDVRVSLDGRAADAEVTGVFLADGSRHLDTHVLRRPPRDRTRPACRTTAASRPTRAAACSTASRSSHAGAQKSNARQVNRNLLLTPGAEIDTKPELEIYADDVQCSHGATTGQLDPAALFYLRSRGLERARGAQRPDPRLRRRRAGARRRARARAPRARRTRPAPACACWRRPHERRRRTARRPPARSTSPRSARTSRSSRARCTASRWSTSTTPPRASARAR